MKQAPICVVITTYNDSEYLSLAIESVLNQSLTPKQIVVIDDGSLSYMSKVITNRYAKNFPEIRFEYEKKQNGGASSARNVGLQKSNQPYVTFLDADDQLLKESLESRFNTLKNLGPEYFGVYGSGITSEGNTKKYTNIDGSISASKVANPDTGIPGACYYYIFRSDALKKIAGFDESLTHNEDFDFIIRLLRSGMICKGSVGYTNKITIRQNSLSRNPNYQKTFNGIMSFLDKAEENNYFKKEHLRYRRRFAHLFLARRVFRENPILSIKHLALSSKYIL